MKRLGVLTYHDSDNYGSVLQAYALSHYINTHGGHCDVIDYRKPAVQVLYRIIKPVKSRHDLLMDLYNILYYGKLRQKKNRFEKFRKDYLPLSSKRYIHHGELSGTEYDTYLVGSDQVWNTRIVDFDTAYMLDFTEKPKFAYAASFGAQKCEKETLDEYAPLLKQFDAISVREKNAVQSCQEALGRNVDIVCDPVFLLSGDEWRKLERACENVEENYVLCYFPGGVSQSMKKHSIAAAKRYNCNRILLVEDWHDLLQNGTKGYQYGPQEFLYLINHATCVCTNSFHGTAFSLLFGKELILDEETTDERIQTIIGVLGKKPKPNIIDMYTQKSKEFLEQFI